MVAGLWYIHDLNYGSLSLFWRCKEHLCPLSFHFGLWRTEEVPDRGLASWYWFGYGHWSLIHPCSESGLSMLIFKVQRTSMSFKSSFWALEDTWGYWWGFGILILIWICSGTFLWSSRSFDLTQISGSSDTVSLESDQRYFPGGAGAGAVRVLDFTKSQL